jgi:hypothetical protein
MALNAGDHVGPYEVVALLGAGHLVDGGTEPRWRQDGRELYYRHKDAVMVVEVSSGLDAVPSVPRTLFSGSASEGT